MIDLDALEIREIEFGSADHALAIALRKSILRDPLGLAFAKEDLAREAADVHLGAFAGRELVGCLVLTSLPDRTIKMRQVAVASSAQGRGVGAKLVRASEEVARRLGCAEIALSARAAAIPFYERLGYEAHGETFIEVTLPHRAMRKNL